jgi:hypothetical protein
MTFPLSGHCQLVTSALGDLGAFDALDALDGRFEDGWTAAGPLSFSRNFDEPRKRID